MGAFTTADAFAIFRSVGGDHLDIDMGAVEDVFAAAAREPDLLAEAAHVFVGLGDGAPFGARTTHVAVETLIGVLEHPDVLRPLLMSIAKAPTPSVEEVAKRLRAALA